MFSGSWDFPIWYKIEMATQFFFVKFRNIEFN
jgi:hypothetical protein